MEFEEFKQGYNQFCQNWQWKGSEEQARFLYGKIDFIPTVAWADIVEDVFATLERFPRIKDFFGLWYAWRKKNSHQLIEDAPNETDCVWCSGIGFLEYRFEDMIHFGYREHSREYNGIAPCGHCENWKRHVSPKMWSKTATYKIEDLGMNGWKWIKPPESCTKNEAMDAIEIALNKLDTSIKEYRSSDLNWKHRQDNYENDIPF